jgi:Ca2+-transporting ATPase
VALTQESDERDVMQRPPVSRRVPIINLHMKTVIAVISSVAGLLTLGVFTYYYQISGSLALARTMAFATLGISTIFTVYSCRSLRTSLLRVNPFANRALTLAVGASLVFQLSAVYLPGLSGILGTVPLGWAHWGVIVLAAIGVLVLIEIIKAVFLKNQTHERE